MQLTLGYLTWTLSEKAILALDHTFGRILESFRDLSSRILQSELCLGPTVPITARIDHDTN